MTTSSRAKAVVAIEQSYAMKLIDVAQRHASRRGSIVAVAVMDAGGNLVASSRMDGAVLSAMPLAIDKAFSAVALGTSTHLLQPSSVPDGINWGVAWALRNRITVLPGGVLISYGKSIAGAIGVSGSSGKIDRECAEMALREHSVPPLKTD